MTLHAGASDVVVPVSVSWHVWPSCNLGCRYCYATFDDVRDALSKDAALVVLAKLLDAGMRRVTFVGGEPLLCPHYLDLAHEAKRRGAEVVLATNGAKLVGAFGDDVLSAVDAVNLSIDGSNGRVMADVGRGNARYFDWCLSVWRRLKSHEGLRLGLNTTVTKVNAGDDMNALVRNLAPERWKVFRVLPVAGQNEGAVDDLLVSDAEFAEFAARHAALRDAGIDVRFEDHDAIEGTYLRLDPLGRFYVNPKGGHHYGPSLVDVGVDAALRAVGWTTDHPEAAQLPERWGS